MKFYYQKLSLGVYNIITFFQCVRFIDLLYMYISCNYMYNVHVPDYMYVFIMYLFAELYFICHER